jgi:hypothetical protein
MTAASSDPFTDPFRAMAGAPGFEPGIAGPKPAALPLGYAPPKRLGSPMSGVGRPSGLSPIGLQVGIAGDASALG